MRPTARSSRNSGMTNSRGLLLGADTPHMAALLFEGTRFCEILKGNQKDRR